MDSKKEMSERDSQKEEILTHSLSLKKIEQNSITKLTISSVTKLPYIKPSSRQGLLNNTVSNSLTKTNLKNQYSIEQQTIPENVSNSPNIKYNNLNKFHNRNLDYIRQIASKLEINRKISLSKINHKTPMERYNKIKKKFILYISDKNNKESNKSLTEEKKIIIPQIEIKEEENKLFYYRIDKGNNMQLIKKCFEYRINWMDFIRFKFYVVSYIKFNKL